MGGEGGGEGGGEEWVVGGEGMGSGWGVGVRLKDGSDISDGDSRVDAKRIKRFGTREIFSTSILRTILVPGLYKVRNVISRRFLNECIN